MSVQRPQFLSRLATQVNRERDMFVSGTLGLDQNQLHEMAFAKKVSSLAGGIFAYALTKAILPSAVGIRTDVPHNSMYEKEVCFAEGIEFIGMCAMALGLINTLSGGNSHELLQAGFGVYGMGKVIALGINASSILHNRKIASRIHVGTTLSRPR